jgi:DNA-binding LacI/PurR family transcriptional regulator/GAF domain-containing protein
MATERARWSGSRPTIGLLLNSVLDPRDAAVWAGAVEAARAHDVNLVCFPGGNADGPGRMLYDLVGDERMDGLVVHLNTHLDEFQDIHQRCGLLPVVNVLRLYEGYPGIVADNYQGMRDVMRHLVEVHGYRRMALVRGAEGDIAANEQVRAYVDAIAEYGLPSDPALLVAGDLDSHSGMAGGRNAVRILLDERKKVVDAIVASDDVTALGVLQELEERGVRVPHDMAVTGFDNIRQSQNTAPPLTTVAQPWRDMGWRAVELVLAQLNGDGVAASTVLPCKLVVRQSCWCWSASVRRAGMHAGSHIPRSALESFVLSEMLRVLDSDPSGLAMASLEPLLDAFSAEVAGRQPGTFLSALDAVLRQAATPHLGQGITRWQDVLSVIRRAFLPSLEGDAVSRSRVEDLVGQARVLVGETAQRVHAQEIAAVIERTDEARQAGQLLVASTELAQLSDVAVQEMPRLGIPGFYVAAYEDPAAPAEWSRLVVAYDVRGRSDLGREGRRFPSRLLVPTGMLPSDKAYTLLVEPLYIQNDPLGFALFALGPLDGRIYEALREQLSAALQGIAHARQTSRRAIQLQTAAEVARAASSMLEPDELMSQVVDLVLERLDLYYVGLFLTDDTGERTGEPGRWALLRAGTGQAGRQMLARELKVEIGDASTVGQCIAQRRARIAQDAELEAGRSSNPLLPHARSVLVLPLIGRGQTIGAMMLQSSLPFAFGSGDIAVLRLMADHVANAILTAHLYSESHETLERIQALYETSRVLSSSRDEAPLMRAVLEGISQRTGCEYAVISIVDTEGHVVEIRHSVCLGALDVFPEWMVEPRIPLDGPHILADVCRTGETVVIDGWDDRLDREIYDRYGHKRLSRVFMPIQLRDHVMGVVEVGYDKVERGQSGRQAIQLLRAFADQVAVVLENTRLLDDAQRSLKQVRVLNEISSAVSRRIRLDQVLQEALTRMLAAAGFDSGLITLADSDTGQLKLAAHQSLPETLVRRLRQNGMEGTLCHVVYQQGDTVALADLMLGAPVDVGGLLDAGLRSYLGVPLVARGETLGTLCAFSRVPLEVSPSVLSLMQSLGQQVGAAAENARLFEQAQERAALEQTLREVSERVGSAVDVETVMRIAVREVGQALGRPAFVHLGNERQAHVSQGVRGNKDER